MCHITLISHVHELTFTSGGGGDCDADKAGKLGTTVQDCVSTLVKSGGVANVGTAKHKVFVSMAPLDISKES